MCRFAAVTAFALLLRSSAAHYEQPPCQHDEVQGEVLGASGYTCSPRCDASYNCQMDMPPGSSATPQCMLQDVDQGAFCGLVCQVDAQCPSGASCKQMSQMGIGLCLYGASFADWARSVTTRKLAVGWPSHGGTLETAQIAKTMSALQNLKSKYSIQDGDVDMLTLKELLNAVSPGGHAGSTQSGSSMFGSMFGFGGSPAPPPAPLSSSPISSSMSMFGFGAPPAPPPPLTVMQAGGASNQMRSDSWSTDLKRLENEVGQGLPGVQREWQRDAYLAEHFNEYGAAYSLLRVVFIFGCIYLVVGSFIKYQMSGSTGIDVIPHIGFWTEYPKLVMDGVAYSKILIDGAMGKSSSSRFDGLNGGLDGDIRGVTLGRGGGAGAFEAL